MDGDEEGVLANEDLLELRPRANGETHEDVNISEDLSARQRKEVQELIQEFVDVFSGIPGATNLEEHNVETTTNEPVRVKQRQMLYAMQAVIKEEVEAMLEADIIGPSEAAYNSLVVIVRKKDGSNHFCIDFRRLNFVTTFDTEPMGNPEAMMAKAGARSIFYQD